MSKRDDVVSGGKRPGRPRGDKGRPAYWRPRVFHNSYTRGGRRHRVRHWHVKIQWAGVRRTLTLEAGTREGAAIEAAGWYERLSREGWEAWEARQEATNPARLAGIPSGGESEPELRLISRPYLARPPGEGIEGNAAAELAVRLEGPGELEHFLLGGSEAVPARAQARRVLEVIRLEGWEAARKRFPRELTIAVQWTARPVMWTYFTVVTSPDHATVPAPGSPGGGVAGRFRVALVEPDPALRATLARWIPCQPGFCCVTALDDVSGLFLEGADADFLLINARLAGSTLPGGLAGAPRLWFSAYPDSEQLFKSTPGGGHGYVLQRTRPDALFSPLSGLEPGGLLNVERMDACVRRHFQAMVAAGSGGEKWGVSRLTPRELEVLSLMSRGRVDKEIAQALGISGWTVHGHVKSIFEKLGVRTRTEAVVHYLGR